MPARPVVLRSPRSGAPDHLRRDGDLLRLLRHVPVLPGGRSPLYVRPGPQRGDRRVAGGTDTTGARSGRRVGRGVSVLPCRGRGRRDPVRAALLAPPRARPDAPLRGAHRRRGVRPVPLRRGCAGGADRGGGRPGRAAPGRSPPARSPPPPGPSPLGRPRGPRPNPLPPARGPRRGRGGGAPPRRPPPPGR